MVVLLAGLPPPPCTVKHFDLQLDRWQYDRWLVMINKNKKKFSVFITVCLCRIFYYLKSVFNAFVTNINNWSVHRLFQKFLLSTFTKDFHKISVINRWVAIFLPSNPHQQSMQHIEVFPDGDSLDGFYPEIQYKSLMFWLVEIDWNPYGFTLDGFR